MFKRSLNFLKAVSFPVFLMSFIVSFFLPLLYKKMISIEFMVLMPLVICLHYQSKTIGQVAQIAYILLTAFALIFGVPGSELGYLSCACMGLFVSHSTTTDNEVLNRYEYRFFSLVTLSYVVASLYLLMKNIENTFSNEEVSAYFGIASINYASLTIASFCSIFSVWCIFYQQRNSDIHSKQFLLLRILSGVLSCIILYMAIIFSTRSATLAFLPLLLYAIQPKRPLRVILAIIAIVFVLYIRFSEFSEFLTLLFVPGRDNLSDLYASELTGGQERTQSALTIFYEALPYLSFCVDCSNYLSYSGLSNLLALSFPFSMFYLYKIIEFIVQYLNQSVSLKKKPQLLLAIIGTSFINSFLMAVLQADFLSTVSLFYVIGIGLNIFKKVRFNKTIL